MRKFWLTVVGLAAMGAPLLSPAGSAQAAQPLPRCETFDLTERWGEAKGEVCSNGQRTRGIVQDKRKDRMAVFVQVRYRMKNGTTKLWDSPEACGRDNEIKFNRKSPRDSVKATAELRTKRNRAC